MAAIHLCTEKSMMCFWAWTSTCHILCEQQSLWCTFGLEQASECSTQLLKRLLLSLLCSLLWCCTHRAFLLTHLPHARYKSVTQIEMEKCKTLPHQHGKIHSQQRKPLVFVDLSLRHLLTLWAWFKSLLCQIRMQNQSMRLLLQSERESLRQFFFSGWVKKDQALKVQILLEHVALVWLWALL
jgi:hypothetical protein